MTDLPSFTENLSSLTTIEQATLANLLLKLQPNAATLEAKPRKKERKRKQVIKFMTEQEIAKFFSVIHDPRDLAIMRVGYHRGLRACEIGMLQLSSYKVAEDILIVERVKGSRGGPYHITKNEVTALKRWLKIRGNEPGPLFPSREGNPISQQMLDVRMKQYTERAGLAAKDLRHFHVLKHSCAVHLANRGESVEDVQHHLGHVNIQSTLVYFQYTNVRAIQRDRRLRDW